jgi:hypothetical protein
LWSGRVDFGKLAFHFLDKMIDGAQVVSHSKIQAETDRLEHSWVEAEYDWFLPVG